MAIYTTDVVAPLLTTTEVVVLFSARVAAKTSLRDCLGRFILERDDLCRIAFFRVGLAGTVARLATRHLSFPTAYG